MNTFRAFAESPTKTAKNPFASLPQAVPQAAPKTREREARKLKKTAAVDGVQRKRIFKQKSAAKERKEKRVFKQKDNGNRHQKRRKFTEKTAENPQKKRRFSRKKSPKTFRPPSFLSKGRLLTVTVFLPKRNVEILLSRLSHAKIPVLGLKFGENTAKVKLRAQDYPLAIAIFKRMCYTVTRVKTGGFLAPLWFSLRRAGASLGAAVFLAVCVFFKPYVFKVEYLGGAAFRKEELSAVLSEVGISPFRPVTHQTLKRGEQTLLARFPSLWFVSVEKRGFYVTVTAEAAPTRAEACETYVLTAPAHGIIHSLTVLRGIPLVKEGDTVALGQELVRGVVLVGTGEETSEIPVPVIAEAVLLCEYAEERVYGQENESLLQLLTMNALKGVGASAPIEDFSEMIPTESGVLYRVRFTYLTTVTGGTKWKKETELG